MSDRDLHAEVITSTSCGSALMPSGTGVCAGCSTTSPTSTKISSDCGAEVRSETRGASGFTSAPASQRRVQAETRRGVFIMLGVVLGLFGIHNFYAGYYEKGLLQLIITLELGPIYIGLVITAVWILFDLLTVRCDADGHQMA